MTKPPTPAGGSRPASETTIRYSRHADRRSAPSTGAGNSKSAREHGRTPAKTGGVPGSNRGPHTPPGPVASEVHVAAATRDGGGLLLLRLFGDDRLGSQEQPRDRRGV